MKATILSAAALAALASLAAPVGAALAHDDVYKTYWGHREDHREHRDFHYRSREFHDAMHDYGVIRNRREHRTLHRALGDVHDDFHYDHPNTRHDHYDWRYRDRSYYSPYYDERRGRRHRDRYYDW